MEAQITRLQRQLEAVRQDAAAAREDAARFRAILASATDYAILTVDPAMRVTSWNEGAENLLGWSGDEALGMDSRLTFVPEDRASGAADAEVAKAAAAKAAAEGRAENERCTFARTAAASGARA